MLLFVVDWCPTGGMTRPEKRFIQVSRFLCTLTAEIHGTVHFQRHVAPPLLPVNLFLTRFCSVSLPAAVLVCCQDVITHRLCVCCLISHVKVDSSLGNGKRKERKSYSQWALLCLFTFSVKTNHSPSCAACCSLSKNKTNPKTGRKKKQKQGDYLICCNSK